MRVVISLQPDERAALGEMARRDMRDPRDQLRYILREAAQTRGILPLDKNEERPRLAQQSALREA
jgi:hypothetical protein